MASLSGPSQLQKGCRCRMVRELPRPDQDSPKSPVMAKVEEVILTTRGQLSKTMDWEDKTLGARGGRLRV